MRVALSIVKKTHLNFPKLNLYRKHVQLDSYLDSTECDFRANFKSCSV